MFLSKYSIIFNIVKSNIVCISEYRVQKKTTSEIGHPNEAEVQPQDAEPSSKDVQEGDLKSASCDN